jgi:hypothetical protein
MRAIYDGLWSLVTRAVGSIPSPEKDSDTLERQADNTRVVAAYEARPTRMFGAYTVWAIYTDGSSHQCDHGTPQYCLEEATRLNAMLLQHPRRTLRR